MWFLLHLTTPATCHRTFSSEPNQSHRAAPNSNDSVPNTIQPLCSRTLLNLGSILNPHFSCLLSLPHPSHPSIHRPLDCAFAFLHFGVPLGLHVTSLAALLKTTLVCSVISIIPKASPAMAETMGSSGSGISHLRPHAQGTTRTDQPLSRSSEPQPKR